MTANPSSFANHTLLQAMTSTRCIFVGLSMRDLNLLRWLGALAAEHEDAWRARWHLHFQQGSETLKTGHAWTKRRPKHLWLTENEDPLLKEYMCHRGVEMRTVAWPSTTADSRPATEVLASLVTGSR